MPVAFLDQLEGLGDDRQGAQPEHVHLDQPQVFDVVLVNWTTRRPSMVAGRRRDLDERLLR